MPNKLLFFLISAILLMMGAVFTFNLWPVLAASSHEKYVRLNDIRGMALYHKGIPYTLNFDQQNETAFFLNNSIVITEIPPSSALMEASFDKIIIYQFNKPDIEILPIGFSQEDLVFTAAALEPSSTLKDISQGAFKHLLLKTYDQ